MPPQTNEPPYEITDPDYLLTKTLVSPAGRKAQIGEPVVFDITIENRGDVDLVTVPLTDTWDAAHLQYVSAIPAPDTVAAGALAWNDLGTLRPTESHTVRVTLLAIASTDAPELNTAITAPIVPPTEPPVPPQTNEPPYEISDPSYVLLKTLVSPTGRKAQVGEDVVFDITITNDGDVDLVTVPLTDTWDPAHLRFVSASVAPNSVLPGHLAWNDLGPLVPGAAHTVRVTLTALASTDVPELNTAVTAPTTPPEEPPVPPRTNEPPYEISDPSFSLVKSVVSPSGRKAQVGEPVVFEITITNDGDVELTTVPLTDTWDATHLEFVEASPAPDTAAPGALVWNDLGALQPGESHTVRVTMLAIASTDAPERNTAIAGPTTPPEEPPVPPQTNEPPYEVSDPGYVLVKSVVAPAGRAAAVGEQVVFDIAVTNTGDVDLATVPLSDTWDPAYLDFVMATVPADTIRPGHLAWNDLGRLAPGETHRVRVTMIALSATPGPELNTAITAPTTPPEEPPVPPQTNQPPYEVTEPDYLLTKAVIDPLGRAARVGDTLTFELTIENRGAVELTTVPLVDTWNPTHLRFLAATTHPDHAAPGRVEWTDLGALQPGESHRVWVYMEALAATPPGSERNTAVTAPTTPPEEPPVPPQTNEPPYEIRSPGYDLVKRVVAPAGRAASIGEAIVFDITITNTGDVELVTVPLTDTWDAAHLQFVSASVAPDRVLPGELAWLDLGRLLPGEAHSVRVTMTALAATDAPELNTAVTAPTVPPTEPPVPPQTNEPPYEISDAGFVLTKTVVSPVDRAAAVGEQFVFDITIDNAGDAPLLTVPLRDTWDAAYLRFVSASTAPDRATAGELVWDDLGRLEPGQSHTVRVTMLATASTPDTERNTAVSGPTVPPEIPPLPPQTNEPPYEVSDPSFTLVKSLVSPAGRAAAVGESVVFDITITNDGDIDLVTVPLSDTWDATHLQFVSASVAPSSVLPGALTWNDLGRLAPGASHSVRVTMTAIAATDAPELNTAIAAPTTPPEQPPLPPQTNEPPYEVTDSAFLLVKSVVSPAGRAAAVGEHIVFDITLRNTGESDLLTVPLTDTWDPTYLEFVGASVAPDRAAPGSLAWNDLGRLAPGQTHTVRVTMLALAATAAPELNSATASPTVPPEVPPVPPQTSEPPYEISDPSFTLVKRLVSPLGRAAAVGEQVVFDIVVTNDGDVELTTVPLTDTWDATHLEYAAATPGPFDIAPGALRWNDLGPLAPGNAHTVRVTMVALAATGTPEHNTAVAAPTVPPEQPPVPPRTNAPPYEISSPAYTLVKSVVSPTDRAAAVGEDIVFKITLRNTGDVDLETVPLTDTWDATHLAFVSASVAPDSAAPGALAWNDLGRLAPGRSHMLTVTMTALAATDGTERNTAVAAPTTPPEHPPVPPRTSEPPYEIADPGYTLGKTRTAPADRAATVGEDIVFEITVRNTGDTPLETVPLTDRWNPAYLGSVSASPAPDTAATGTLAWNDLGRLAPGEHHSVTVTMTALAPTPAGEVNTAATAPTTPPESPPVPPRDDEAPYDIVGPRHPTRQDRLRRPRRRRLLPRHRTRPRHRRRPRHLLLHRPQHRRHPAERRHPHRRRCHPRHRPQLRHPRRRRVRHRLPRDHHRRRPAQPRLGHRHPLHPRGHPHRPAPRQRRRHRRSRRGLRLPRRHRLARHRRRRRPGRRRSRRPRRHRPPPRRRRQHHRHHHHRRKRRVPLRQPPPRHLRRAVRAPQRPRLHPPRPGRRRQRRLRRRPRHRHHPHRHPRGRRTQPDPRRRHRRPRPPRRLRLARHRRRRHPGPRRAGCPRCHRHPPPRRPGNRHHHHRRHRPLPLRRPARRRLPGPLRAAAHPPAHPPGHRRRRDRQRRPAHPGHPPPQRI